MSQATPKYLLDTNIFIQAHRRYYGFDICPGFWACLLHYEHAGRLCSIDRVRAELLSGGKGDVLEDWVKTETPESFFVSTQTTNTARHFSGMMQWVQGHPQFKPEAKDEFARVADGWLVAHAAAEGYTVVTHEEFDPAIKKKVPIPNLCKEFHVPCINTFQMLSALSVRFDWETPRRS